MQNASRICQLGAIFAALLVSATALRASTPTPTATPELPCLASCLPVCTGDCNEDGVVGVNELVTAVNIALGTADVSACLAADHNEDGQVTVDELVLAVNNALQGCPEEAPLGERRFSLAPETSIFAIETASVTLEDTGLTGFIDFDAAVPDPETGLARISIVDASEYISMSFAPPGLEAIALCLRPVREALPVVDAGSVSCQGGYDFGAAVTQDHNIGIVGVDGFTEEDCSDAGGVVEPPSAMHSGVCNGPFVSSQPGGDSGTGAVLITADEMGQEGGFPVTISLESALPCGDEGAEGSLLPLVLTSATLTATIIDRNDVEGEVLLAEREGENFSCEEWTQENSSGRLVFATPVLHGLMGEDAIFVFVFDD
jgi:hypothetical protein